MPGRDPSFWHQLLTYIALFWPQIYAGGLAFVVALIRGLHAGNKTRQSWLEAILCGCLTFGLFPVLHYLGLPGGLAASIGAIIAFKGTEWFGDRADELYDKLVGRWLK